MTTAGELLYDNLLRWQRSFARRGRNSELQGMKRGSVAVVQALAEGVSPPRWREIIASWPWLELDLQVADTSAESASGGLGRRPDPRSAGAGWTQRSGLCRTGGGDCDASGPSRGAKALSLGELSPAGRHIVPGAPIVHERVALLSPP